MRAMSRGVGLPAGAAVVRLRADRGVAALSTQQPNVEGATWAVCGDEAAADGSRARGGL